MRLTTSLILAALLLPLCAAADDRLTLSANLVDGACRDTFTGEAKATASASLDYRHESELHSVRAYGRVAPAGGNCTDTAYAHDVSVEQRFDLGGGWHGLVRAGAEQATTVGSYRHAAGGLVLFANETDGSPSYSAIAGAGRDFELGALGLLTVEAGINLARNDYVDDSPFSANSGHVGLSFSRAVLGGELEADFEVEGPRLGALLDTQTVRWSRGLGSRLDLSLTWRRWGGLDRLASPFAPVIVRDGREYAFLSSDPTLNQFEVGITVRF